VRQVVPEHLRKYLPVQASAISLMDRVTAAEEALKDVLARLSALEDTRGTAGSKTRHKQA